MLLKIKPADLIANKDIKFGTSGLRGLVSDFSDLIVASYTVAFITHLQRSGFKFKKVVVGNDLRASSPRLVNAVFHGIKQCNLTPIYGGAVPTPALIYYGLQNHIPTIMVTGSHIPDDRNGLKFSTPTGEITKDDEQKISQLQLQLEISGFNKSGTLKIKEHARKDTKILVLYKNRYARILPENLLTGLKIGIYEHSSVARDFYKELYEFLGAEVLTFGRSHSFVPVDTEAIRREDISIVKGWCAVNKVHCVVSSDGDGDRPLVFDESGNPIKGDILGILVAKVLKATTVVTPVSSNTAVERCKWFEKVVRTKIGSPYVLEAMKKEEDDVVIGFEANGGVMHNKKLNILYGDLEPLPTRDATLVHICLLVGIIGNKLEASKLRALLPSRHVCSGILREVNLFKTKKYITEISSLSEGQSVLGIKIKKIDLTDGLRITSDNEEVVHLRISGNAPELRCYCEAEEDIKAEILVNRVLYSLREKDLF